MKSNSLHLQNKPLIFFDGYCNLCSGAVQFILKYERREHYYFTSLQSNFTQLNFPELAAQKEQESVVLYENGNIYTHSGAALRVCKELVFPFRMAYYLIFIPRFIRDPVYSVIAAKRYRFFGKRESCFMPDVKYARRFLH